MSTQPHPKTPADAVSDASTTASDAEQAIEDALAAPKSGTQDGVSFTNHSISDLIQAGEYLKSKRRGSAFRISTTSTPNALGD